MKKIIACFLAFLLSWSSVPETGNGYIKIDAIATAPDVFTLPDGSTIKIYSDVLQLNESYILLIDTLNDNEILNYWDFETYELENNNY